MLVYTVQASSRVLCTSISSTSLLIYKQTILPILDYVSVIVNSSTQRKIAKLQPLQNTAIRTIRELNGYISTSDVEDLHKDLNLKLLADRRKWLVLSLVYKMGMEED